MANKQLLFSITKKDFIIQPFKGSGAGGQNRNKVMSCCRITHPASGAVSEAQEQRDFHQNKKMAFKRLVEKPEFKKWFKVECAKHLSTYVDAEKWADEQMSNLSNFKYEVKINGKWTEINYKDITDLEYDSLED